MFSYCLILNRPQGRYLASNLEPEIPRFRFCYHKALAMMGNEYSRTSRIEFGVRINAENPQALDTARL